MILNLSDPEKKIKCKNNDVCSLKNAYRDPELIVHGLIQDVTLGGTPGTNDSGAEGTENVIV